ncbi:hypothetical protein QM012_001536 [Aureobasidium pullulans]|uniref:Uncharacterized protein n=1 Tax=Aureobasidium pullulans TaxID=5580 RepID=A0ABR0TFI5_AURPU
MSTLVSDDDASLATRCMVFETRIASYASELTRMEALNHAIHKEYHKHQLEQRCDRLIDSVSPELKSAVSRDKNQHMIMKESKKRRKRLSRGLEVVKVGIEKLKTEIEGVLEEMKVHHS